MEIKRKGFYRFLEDCNIRGSHKVVCFRRGEIIEVIKVLEGVETIESTSWIKPKTTDFLVIVLRHYEFTLGYVNNDLPVEEVEVTKKKEPEKKWVMVM